jgi:hypothetical protein
LQKRLGRLRECGYRRTQKPQGGDRYHRREAYQARARAVSNFN